MKETGRRRPSGTEEELRKIEAEARAASLAGDAAIFERVATEDFLSIDPRGAVRNKAEALEHRRSGQMKFHSIEASEERVRIYEGAAVVTGTARVRGESGGSRTGGTYRYTRVYVKRNGMWRIVSSQSTAVAG